VKSVKVLVIEDDRLTQLYYASILENLNITAIACLTYAKALVEMVREDYDLILSDVKLKDGNGIDLLRHFDKERQNRIPFVVFSGYTKSELIELYGQFNASAVLTKPLGVQELTKVICELLKLKSPS
jgi:CheY-like chemotaxis protein